MPRGPAKPDYKTKYSKELRASILERAAAGERVDALAKEIGVTSNTIYYWKRRQRDPYKPTLFQESAGVKSDGGLLEHSVRGGGGGGFNSYLGWWYPHRNYNGDLDRPLLIKPYGKG